MGVKTRSGLAHILVFLAAASVAGAIAPARAEDDDVPPTTSIAPAAPEPAAPEEVPSMPSPPASASEPVAQGQSEEKFDPRTPRYTVLRPHWGVQLAVSPRAFPEHQTESDTFTSFDQSQLRAASIQVEYQPPGIQNYGIIGFGPSVGVYPTLPTGTTRRPWSLWSAGAQIRYQARFFREQPLVPYASYQLEYWNYVVDGYSGRTLLKGPVLGAALLLNWFDRAAANDFYSTYGVTRSYLIAEMRFLSGGDSNVHLQGTSYFFGLRFEL